MSLARATDLRPEDLAGRTWAGYVRESTKGQADRYGPDIQRTEQTRFAERHGLVTTGLEYLDLVSGKDTLRRSDFTRMVGDAEAGAFEVLLVRPLGGGRWQAMVGGRGKLREGEVLSFGAFDGRGSLGRRRRSAKHEGRPGGARAQSGKASRARGKDLA